MKSPDTTNLKGSAAVDSAVKASSNFKSAQTAINQMISDCKSYIAADSKNGRKNFLLEKCGINLDNSDTGAITGSDAGGSKVKTSESVVPESGSLKKFTGNSFTVNGLTFTLEKDFKTLSAKEQFIWQGLYTWWAKSSLDLVSESYGYSFTNSDVTFKKVTVKFVDNSSTWLAWYSGTDTESDGKVDKVTLNINMKYYKDIDVTNSNGKSSSADFYLDKTLAHEFTHIAMAAKVNNFFKLPEFLKEGMADLTVGIDNERLSSITYLTKNLSVMSSWLNLNYTGDGSNSNDYSYAAGYIFLRYLGKQGSTTTSSPTTTGKNLTTSKTKVSVGGTNYNDTIVTSGSYVTITGGNGADSISSTKGTNVKISSGDGNDSIYVSAQTASIDSGAGNDYVYLYSQATKTTVKTGTGNDSIMSYAKGVLYQYASGDGNDSISGFGTTDTLSISGGSYTSVKSGKNLVVQVGNGKITLVGAANLSKINIVGSSSTVTTPATTSSSATTLTVTNSTKSPVTVGAAVKTIDASKRTTPIKITGNALDNSIYGGSKNDTVYGGDGNDTLYGGTENDYLVGGDGNDYLCGNAGNDSLWGGKGNDSLYGGAGTDKFFYANGDGKDIIFDFDNNDLLQITGAFSATYDKKSNAVSFKVGTTASAITLANISATTFNINGTNYHISGTKLVK